jgi:hypothetical protein
LNAATGVFLLLLALVAANLPFLTERVLFVLRRPVKSGWWRVAELLVAYLLVGIVARVLEARAGPIYAQNWEFYAITGCLFLVLAFPGFVYRYLWKHHS